MGFSESSATELGSDVAFWESAFLRFLLRRMYVLVRMMSRINTPATVPPAIAPVWDFEGEGVGVEGEVEFAEVGLAEAGRVR